MSGKLSKPAVFLVVTKTKLARKATSNVWFGRYCNSPNKFIYATFIYSILIAQFGSKLFILF